MSCFHRAPALLYAGFGKAGHAELAEQNLAKHAEGYESQNLPLQHSSGHMLLLA